MELACELLVHSCKWKSPSFGIVPMQIGLDPLSGSAAFSAPTTIRFCDAKRKCGH